MLRKIIKIDADKCNGCGLCAEACHEDAIGMVDGKAVLLRDDYCDGLGDCLPACPTGAITFEEREAAAYDEAAVKARQAAKASSGDGCPGARSQVFAPQDALQKTDVPESTSRLAQWPVQIKLAPANAPFFDGADLLIAADCAAYAHAGFHEHFMRGRVTLIGCPKLDMVDYSEKLCEILRQNNVHSVTVVRMEVPCCGGIEQAVIAALQGCGKMLPWRVATLSVNGAVLSET